MADDPGPRLEIGRITKPHGLHGEVLVALTTTEQSRLAAGSVLHADGRELVVRAAYPHLRRWIVALEGIDTRQAAESLQGLVLHAEPKTGADDEDPTALWVHELVGATVVDTGGREWGPVVAVVANPASDLLELESGALVPLRFVLGGIETTPGGRYVRVDPPEGLLD
jgi:16S rRNA processing protein RimM